MYMCESVLNGGMHVQELQGPDVGMMCNNGDEVHWTVSACTASGNKAALCMCMAAEDSCGPELSMSGGDLNCF